MFQIHLSSHPCSWLYFLEPFTPKIHILTHLQQTAFENIVGKEEIAHNEQFLLFPQCFLLNQIILSQFVHIFDIISYVATELEEPKIGISGKGFKKKKHCHTFQERYLLATADLIALCALQAITPAVRETVSALQKGEKKGE